ncbi:protein FAM227B [Gopherus flavomarginatus]|uniref:protein FAM227B n=1 Tax=Gopherus flavomarginatus TaxID=286002 RepID=UPI0021CC4804|nr:protein FAM227B [Gopherus flavomarginatus]
MQGPPGTFEEFLQSQKLDDWPRFPFLDEDRPLVDKLRNDYSLDAISKFLCDSAPLQISLVSDLEKRIDGCTAELKKHAEKIFSFQQRLTEEDDHRVSLQQTNDTQFTDSEEISIQTGKMGKTKIDKYITEESSRKNVKNYRYPGFKLKQLTELPRHLEAAKLWDLVIKAHNFKGEVFKVWRKLFLSEASIAVLQDCFWWWFLQKFKPNQEDQDYLFDRIADSFVSLFLCVPSDTKDAFFQVYPDCLSQVIYVAFCEAFPESNKSFDDAFKDGLVDLIFQWVSGLKPQKFAWKKWNLECLKKPTVNSNKKDTITKAPVKESGKSKAVIDACDQIGSRPLLPEAREQHPTSHSSVRFQVGLDFEDLTEDTKKMYISSAEEIKDDSKCKMDMPKESKTIKESCYIGSGPDFQHVLFRIGGRSPLVSYYLKLHEITDGVSSSLTYKMNRTEICKLPPVAPTYQEVIKETRRLRREFREDYTVFQNKCKQDISEIEKQRKEINQKFRRLTESTSKNPSELRLSADMLMHELEFATWDKKPPSSGRSTFTSSDPDPRAGLLGFLSSSYFSQHLLAYLPPP